MSFSFEWPRFSEQFHKDAIEMLNSALNKGSKPPVIADKIEVVELEMGTQVRSHSVNVYSEFLIPALVCGYWGVILRVIADGLFVDVCT